MKKYMTPQVEVMNLRLAECESGNLCATLSIGTGTEGGNTGIFKPKPMDAGNKGIFKK